MPRHYSHTMTPDDPNRRRAPRMHLGRPPNPEQRPVTIAQLHDGETCWNVCVLRSRIGAPTSRLSVPQEASDEWLNLKLWADGRALHKANYWTAYNPIKRRFTIRGDGRALAERQPLMGLLNAVMELIADELKNGMALESMLLYVARKVGDTVEVTEDPLFDELLTHSLMRKMGAKNQPRLFTEADLPRLRFLGKLISAERLPQQGWRTVRDELTGGITIEAK